MGWDCARNSQLSFIRDTPALMTQVLLILVDYSLVSTRRVEATKPTTASGLQYTHTQTGLPLHQTHQTPPQIGLLCTRTSIPLITARCGEQLDPATTGPGRLNKPTTLLHAHQASGRRYPLPASTTKGSSRCEPLLPSSRLLDKGVHVPPASGDRLFCR
jgi:hypothetical protein